MTPEKILALLGGQAVLLEIERGSKAPIRNKWQKLTIADMTPEYLATFNGHANIGVSPGSRIHTSSHHRHR